MGSQWETQGSLFHKMHRERNWALSCALNGKGILHARPLLGKETRRVGPGMVL